MCCSQNTCKRPRWSSNLSSLAPQPRSWPFTTGFTTTASGHSHRMRFSFKSTFLLSSQCVSFILPTTLKKQVGDIQHLYFTHITTEAARTRLTNSYLRVKLLTHYFQTKPLSSEACWSSLVWVSALTGADCSSRPLSHSQVRHPQ